MFAIIVHFNIQKLKNKQTFIQTEKAKSSHFDRTRGEKKKTDISHPNPNSTQIIISHSFCQRSLSDDIQMTKILYQMAISGISSFAIIKKINSARFLNVHSLFICTMVLCLFQNALF